MAKQDRREVPIVDERIIFRGTTYLRQLTATALRDLDKIVVFQEGSEAERLAVLMPYDQFIILQERARE